MDASINFKNKSAFFISILSFFFLIPGIYLSMLTISTTGSINAEIPHVTKGFFGFPKVEGTEQRRINVKVFDTKRSILNTVRDLWNKDYVFVACMIFLFSIIVPVIKGVLFLYIFFQKQLENREKIFNFIKTISKWSMCDVFIVAIFLAYLSTGAGQTNTNKSVSVMGYTVDVNFLAGMHAELHSGFWCFLTYCLLSMVAFQLYKPN